MRMSIKRYAALGGICFLLLMTVSHMYILYTVDVSIAPVRPPCSDEVHIVSYADGGDVYVQNQNFLALSAVNQGVDHIHTYGRRHVDSQYIAQHAKTFSKKRGAGYWLWKTYIIQKTLEQASENAVVIYLDGSFCVTQHIQPLVDYVKHHDIAVVVHDDLGTTIESVTQKHTLVGMNCHDEGCRNGRHLLSGVLILRNTPAARAFVKKWKEACEEEDLYIPRVDNPSATIPEENCQESKRFEYHLPEESMLSILCHQDPTHKNFIPSNEFNKLRVVRWHHRHYHHPRLPLLPYVSRKIRRALKYFYWMWSYPLARWT